MHLLKPKKNFKNCQKLDKKILSGNLIFYLNPIVGLLMMQMKKIVFPAFFECPGLEVPFLIGFNFHHAQIIPFFHGYQMHIGWQQ